MSTEVRELARDADVTFYGALSFEVAWHAYSDACPKCLRLDGQVWTFPRLTGILGHPDFGAVYDLDADVSLTHPNCRCYLEFAPSIDWEKTDVYNSLKDIFDEMHMEMPSNMDEANRQVAGLRANVGQARGELRELEYILYRTTSLMHRIGLPPEINYGIEQIQRMILMVRMLHSTLMYLQMGTPFGIVVGIISALSVGATYSISSYDAARGREW
jgi:hypothetical protein